MSLVAIIGAGEIGGAVARALASRARVDAVRLIDDNESVAAGKALDLMQSGPISRSDTRIDGAADLAAAGGRIGNRARRCRRVQRNGAARPR